MSNRGNARIALGMIPMAPLGCEKGWRQFCERQSHHQKNALDADEVCPTPSRGSRHVQTVQRFSKKFIDSSCYDVIRRLCFLLSFGCLPAGSLKALPGVSKELLAERDAEIWEGLYKKVPHLLQTSR